MPKADPRSSGVPQVKSREASLNEYGSPVRLTIRVAVPDGEINSQIEAVFKVDEGLATLHSIDRASKSSSKLFLGTYLPGVVAAERAAIQMHHVDEVHGVAEHLEDAQVQGKHGWRYECSDCGERAWGDEAGAAERTDGLTGGVACPNCGTGMSEEEIVVRGE